MRRAIYEDDVIKLLDKGWKTGVYPVASNIHALPSAQPEYEPVKIEDFAKTMSENTIYSFLAWFSKASGLMERHGFVICKKTM